MGQFSEMLNKLNKIEADGFNPMTESYSARIGKLETVTDPTEPLTAESITKSFTDIGYDDPLATLVNEQGGIDNATLSSAYNRAIDDPKLGVDSNAFIGFINQNYPQELSTSYFPDAQIQVNEDQSLGFPENKRTSPDKLRFERAPSQSQKRGASDIFLQFNEDTGESKAFDTQAAYDEARLKYKAITGNDVKTGQKDSQ